MARRGNPRATIYVIAGTNGAGKSSLAGSMFRARGATTFDPDDATQRILAANPTLALERANSLAWHQGVRLLQKAIREAKSYAIETTLGGSTITGLLHSALDERREVRILYVGLEGPDLHVSRVRARVRAGGHDVPEARVRDRYRRSLENLVGLLPRLTELRVFDNSAEREPAKGIAPEPRLILHTSAGKIRTLCRLQDVPAWAKPIVAAALREG
ncbi:MAG: AAA family ATPase [Gemmatimonadota bacterium]